MVQAEGAAASIRLWPKGAPGGDGVTVVEEEIDRSPPPAELRDRIIKSVRDPDLKVFRPKVPNGASLLIAPGGQVLHRESGAIDPLALRRIILKELNARRPW